jgi:CBS domain-containing protein
MKIEEILRKKGHDVLTITESKSVLAAAEVLVEHNIGGLVVMKGEHATGIVTERDILRATARRPGELDSIRVGEVMTRDLITAKPEDQLLQMMDVMAENKIRHLPILEGDRLAGIISIGDLVNACRVVAEEENSQLRQYIAGAG